MLTKYYLFMVLQLKHAQDKELFHMWAFTRSHYSNQTRDKFISFQNLDLFNILLVVLENKLMKQCLLNLQLTL